MSIARLYQWNQSMLWDARLTEVGANSNEIILLNPTKMIF